MNLQESEKKRILNLHEKEKQDYVFDFVITENEKYLILMDNVFMKDGKSLGTIWENTHIFDEILTESVQKNLISEGVSRTYQNYIWSKELIREWANEEDTLTEGWWDDLKGKVGESAKLIFKKGILPAFRWLRRKAYTNVGIVVDIIVAIVGGFFPPVKVGQVGLWATIVLLDLYEIATGDFDPEDTERKNSPFIGLIGDAVSLAFTGMAGKPVAMGIKTAAAAAAKTGAKVTLKSSLVKTLQSLLNKIPYLSKMTKGIGSAFKKAFPNGAILNKMISSVDNILKKLGDFIRKLLPKNTSNITKQQVKQATKKGVKDSTIELGMNNVGMVIPPQTSKGITGLFDFLRSGGKTKLSLNENEKITLSGVLNEKLGFAKRAVDYLDNISPNFIRSVNSNLTQEVDLFINTMVKKGHKIDNVDEFYTLLLSNKKIKKVFDDLSTIKLQEHLTKKYPNLNVSNKKELERFINALPEHEIDEINNSVLREIKSAVSKKRYDMKKTQNGNKSYNSLVDELDGVLKSKHNIDIASFRKSFLSSAKQSVKRAKDLHKKSVVIDSTGKRTITQSDISGGVKIIRLTAKIYSIAKFLVLGGVGVVGAYYLYNIGKELMGGSGEPFIIEDENGNPLIDPTTDSGEITGGEETNGSETTNNGEETQSGTEEYSQVSLPTELQNIIDTEGGEIINNPKEGILFKNDEYPNGMYLYTDGSYYDATAKEYGEWGKEEENIIMELKNKLSLIDLLSEQSNEIPKQTMYDYVNTAVNDLDGWVGINNLNSLITIVKGLKGKTFKGQNAMDAFIRYYKADENEDFRTEVSDVGVRTLGPEGIDLKDELINLIDGTGGGTSQPQSSSNKKIAGNIVKKTSSPSKSGGSSTSTKNATTTKKKSSYKPCNDFPFGIGCINPVIGQLQKKLGLGADNKFGPMTQKAIKDLGYQLPNGNLTSDIWREIINSANRGGKTLNTTTGNQLTNSAMTYDINTPKGFYDNLREKGYIETISTGSNSYILSYTGPKLNDEDAGKLNTYMKSRGFSKSDKGPYTYEA